MRSSTFFLIALAVGAVFFGLSRFIESEYYFFAGYVVLQYIVLATAWNILGGYTGYVNFGTAAFFAIGAYSSVALHKFQPTKWVLSVFGLDIPLNFLDPLFPLPIPVLIVVGGVVSGVVGLGMGYLTLRLRGAFFAIATLALAVVVQTLVTNWDYVGGSRGAYILRPATAPLVGSYIEYLFLIMLILSVIAVSTARAIERSRLGYGFATIRDDELAAEASGVPTLKLKLIATTLSGAFMGMAGAPLPYYVTYLDPASGFSLAYAVNSIAMPLVGGTTTWIGPVIGAILLGTIQQVATVTISSAVNLLIVGLVLVAFVIIAPKGIVGLFQDPESWNETKETWNEISRQVAQPLPYAVLHILLAILLFRLAWAQFETHMFGTVDPSGLRIPTDLFYWMCLAWLIAVGLVYLRGKAIGHAWIVIFPLLGAIFSLAPDLNWVPLVPTVLNVVCIICALALQPRHARANPVVGTR